MNHFIWCPPSFNFQVFFYFFRARLKVDHTIQSFKHGNNSMGIEENYVEVTKFIEKGRLLLYYFTIEIGKFIYTNQNQITHI